MLRAKLLDRQMLVLTRARNERPLVTEVVGGWMADAEEVTLQLLSGGELSVRLDRPESGSAFVAWSRW